MGTWLKRLAEDFLLPPAEADEGPAGALGTAELGPGSGESSLVSLSGTSVTSLVSFSSCSFILKRGSRSVGGHSLHMGIFWLRISSFTSSAATLRPHTWQVAEAKEPWHCTILVIPATCSRVS